MVEWKKLGEVCTVHTGDQLNRSNMLDDGPYPVVNGGREYSGYTDKYNENANTITISQGGESAGFVNWINVKFWAGAHCYVVEETVCIDKRFLYHTLKNKEREIQKSKQGAGIPGLNRNTLYKQIIPLPSISEQQRIVKQLDTFTSSIENLKIQITLRRKQYEYYLDKLFDLEGKEGVEIKKLGEIGEFVRGKRFVRTDIVKKGVPCLHYGDFYTTYSLVVKEVNTYLTQEIAAKLRFAEKNDVIIVAAGENNIDIGVGVVWLGDEPAAVHDACFIFKHNQNPMYISYFLRSTSYHQQIKKEVSSGKICSISSIGLGRADIPIPPISEQQRVVDILDKFKDGIQNLEAQLAGREKQYEYYRNKLLTFE